jgi:hypothetical protein
VNLEDSGICVYALAKLKATPTLPDSDVRNPYHLHYNLSGSRRPGAGPNPSSARLDAHRRSALDRQCAFQAFGIAPLQQRQQLRKSAYKGIRKGKENNLLIRDLISISK